MSLFKDLFNPASTTAQIRTTAYATGIERVMLSAFGDFQRLLNFVWPSENQKAFAPPLPNEKGEQSDFFSTTPFSPSNLPQFTLSSILRAQALSIPNAPFSAYPADGPLGLEYKEVTVSQFRAEVLSVAQGLREALCGVVGEKRCVGVIHESSYRLVVLVMALLELNASVFLLAPANSEEAVRHLLVTCDASVVVHSGTYAGVAQRSGAHPILVGNSYPAVVREIQPLFESPPEIPIIVHSSGSTSFPKPVRYSQTAFLANCQIMLTRSSAHPNWSAFQNPQTRFLCLGPLYHAMGLTLGLGGALCGGSTLVFPLTRSWPPSPEDVVNSLRSTKVTTAVIVPMLLEQVCETACGVKLLRELDLVLTGGAHCPPSLAHTLVTSGINLKNIYGASETGHLMIGDHARPAEGDTESWALVHPFPNTEPLFVPVPSDDSDKDLFQVHLPRGNVRMAHGVLNDGEETWNTGDVVQRVTRSDGVWYRLLYRDDDILVHVSGEKTNPIPIEVAARASPLIARIAVVGHQRPVCAAIVQLRKEVVAEEGGVRREVCRVVTEACRAAPSHSRVLDEMVYIVGDGKSIPVTPKGNPIRPKVLNVFKEELDALYAQFVGSTTRPASPMSDVTYVSGDINVEAQVVKVFLDTIGSPASFESKLDPNVSLFDLGLDSVTALRLRKNLMRTFDVSLPSQFVYQHFSVTKLVLGISSLIAPSKTKLEEEDNREPSRAAMLDSLIQKQVGIIKAAAPAILASRLISQPPRHNSREIVALVGASGSLGAQQLLELLKNPDVEQIVCLLRGLSTPSCYDKLRAALPELISELHGWEAEQLSGSKGRVMVVPFELGKALEPSVFADLAGRVTTVIQTAWKMDFNRVVGDFEDCIKGTTHLLLLSAFLRPSRFYFVSSIGVVLSSPVSSSPVSESLTPWTPSGPLVVSPHGYSESKFVAEQVILRAARILDIQASVTRIGQICGHTQSGKWNVQEMNVLILKGSARIGKFPVPKDTLAVVDWAPVDLVAATTVELALRPGEMGKPDVWHIVHPHPISYQRLLEHLSDAGLHMRGVSPAEWWNDILNDEGNPCLAVEAYITEAVVRECNRGITLDVKRTMRAARNSLESVPGEVGSEVWAGYVRYWRGIGFLP